MEKLSTRIPFTLGEARSRGALTVIPLFAARAELEYVGLDEAFARGLLVGEEGAVESVIVENPLREHVFLYEGEELVGAMQNRIVRRTALLGAGSTI